MVIKEHDAIAGRRVGVGEPVKIVASTAPAGTGAGQLLEIPVPANFITKIRGMSLDAAANQTITGVFLNSVAVANKIHDGAAIGTDITLTKLGGITVVDLQDLFGEDIHITDKLIVQFTQGAGAETLTGTLWGTKYPVLA